MVGMIRSCLPKLSSCLPNGSLVGGLGHPAYGSIKPHATIGKIDGMITGIGVFQMICSSAVEGGSARKQAIIFENQTRGSMVIIILQLITQHISGN